MKRKRTMTRLAGLALVAAALHLVGMAGAGGEQARCDELTAQDTAAEKPAEEKELVGPLTFNSELPLEVWALTIDWEEMEGVRSHIGRTPADEPLHVPECTYWWVESGGEPGWEVVAREMARRDIPGLRMRGAADAGLQHLRGLCKLRELYISGTQVTDAAVEAFKEALPEVRVSH